MDAAAARRRINLSLSGFRGKRGSAPEQDEYLLEEESGTRDSLWVAKVSYDGGDGLGLLFGFVARLRVSDGMRAIDFYRVQDGGVMY